jgi:SAM-dependent methyltransferase
MSLVRSRIHWDDLAMLDPCWAILSQPEKRHGKWGIKEFFATGADEVSELMNSARQLGLPHEFCRALDFGCGIGRLTHALSSFFGHVTGVDISQPMISRAAALVGKSNCSFVVNSTEFLPFNTETFDLVLSTIVLQHVPDQQAIRNYLAEFGRVLKPSGMLVVQLPSYIPRRRRIQLRPRYMDGYAH